MVKKIILYFLLWKAFIFSIALIFEPLLKNDYIFLPRDQHFYAPYQSHPLIRMFANFDGASYLKIAREGYFPSELGYFPFYPMVIQFFSNFTLGLFLHRYYVITAEVISNASFLLALYMFYKIAKEDNRVKIFPLLLLIVLLFPTSFFYGAAYNDSLFLLLATLTIYTARKGEWIVASIFGAFATLTRLNGLALVFLILGEYFLQHNTHVTWFFKNISFHTWKSAIRQSIRWRNITKEKLAFVFLIPSAFIVYLIYISLKFGTFMQLFSSMGAWEQDQITFPLQVVWRYIKIVFLYPTFKFNYWIAVLELASVGLYCFILWYSFKKIRFSYWIFMLISILIPWLTGIFQGMPRYGLHLYPFFLGLAVFLQEKSMRFRIGYFVVSIVLLVTLLVLFTHGYFVA